MIHPTADVQTKNIGSGTVVWQFVIILPGASIGTDCNINCHTFIENKVVIGNRVTIKSGVYIWDNIIIEDDVFVGPNVTFVNDKNPRSKKYPGQFQSIKIGKGASIGANTTIMGNITIGEYAMIGAGSVVTKNVPAFALAYGNPAKQMGQVDENGLKIEKP
ncbi:MAG TPA: acyltransferase [Chitinophagaceae bacterium]|nr:acyltransferase [Chitinophagaceae bacterium]